MREIWSVKGYLIVYFTYKLSPFYILVELRFCIMVIILDDNLKHVAHARRKIGHLKGKQ